MWTKRLNVVLFFLLLFPPLLSIGQIKEKENLEQVWLAYFNQVRLSSRWGASVDLHLRTRDDFFSRLSIGIVRTGLVYHLNDHARLIAGYSYVHNYPSPPNTKVARPEHRPWQMFQWSTRYSSLQLVQGLRLEERFRRKLLNGDALDEGYNFNYRFRYNFLMQVPLGKKKMEARGISLMLNDEIQINMGKEIVYNYFDQNRFFIGWDWQINKSNHLQFGYTHIFQQLSVGNLYRNIDGIRIYFLQNFDLRKS